MSNQVYQSLETPPVTSSTFDPMDYFTTCFPLTPGQSQEGIAYEVTGQEFHNLTPLSPVSVPVTDEGVSNLNEVADKTGHPNQVLTQKSSPIVVKDANEHRPDWSTARVTETGTEQNTGNEEKKVKTRRTRNRDTSSERHGKAATRALQYPPCSVCGGKASGDHYGVNSCEACKGFFRRYLLREKGAYQCKKSGNCEVVHSIKGICAGCRLRKCLLLGMAKEKCKLGRYSSEKRTEKIRTALELKEVQTVPKDPPAHTADSLKEDNFISLESPCQDTAQQDEILTRTLSKLDISGDRRKTFCDELVADLIEAKDNIRPFDVDKCLTDEEIQTRIKEYHEQYMLKVKMYGEMKTIPKDEFTKLYGDFGIDVDDRMEDLKLAAKYMEEDVNRYCSFVKRIPYFSKLSFKDQSNLLKVGRMDFYTTMLSQGYNPELQVFLYRFKAYHVDEMDKFFSRELIMDSLLQYRKCQKLRLNDAEKCLVMALCLFFTDRCKLENSNLVEMIQLSLAQMLQRELMKTCPTTATSRFAKIIDYLTSLRDVAGQYMKEYEDLCRDDLYVNECPLMTDFLLET